MIRRFLASYMTVVLVAGPSLCCCTTLYAVPPSTTGSASTSPDHMPPCCCKDYCPAKAENASGNPQGIDDKSHPDPKPGKHQCPCKDKGTKQTLDQPSPSLTAEAVARLLTATFQFVPVALTADPGVDLDSGGGSSPPGHRLTSWRLLQAHHLLRC